MVDRDKPRSFSYRNRVHSNPIIKPPQRLIFPSKQSQQGYIGKKQYIHKTKDNVVLQSPDSSKFIRKNKLDVTDIEGTKPKLIQILSNLQKHHKKQKNQFVQQNKHQRRIKTQAIDSLDSLDILIKNRSDKSLTKLDQMKKNQSRIQVEKYLLKRNLELTKQNILGIGFNFQPYTKLDKASKRNMINPTYLSNLNSS